MSLLDIWAQLPPDAVKLLQSVVAIVVIFITYKYLSRLLSRTGKNAELEPHAMNAARLVLRVAAIMVASTVLLRVWSLPTDWFVGSSALIGAVLGFGSRSRISY